MRDGDATKAAIVEAATKLFFERGFYGTSMRDIADAVGIKAASIYNHAASKEALLYQIALGSIEELYELGMNATLSINDPQSQLRAVVRSHVIYHAQPSKYRAKVSDDQLHALSEEHLTEVLAVRDKYESLLKAVLVRGRDLEGWNVADAAVTTFAIATMCTAVGAWFNEGGRLSAEQVADIYADLALSAMTAPAQALRG
jgi:TetR/AcrR family transcriptional regulator, cholesterol catabolism regulator